MTTGPRRPTTRPRLSILLVLLLASVRSATLSAADKEPAAAPKPAILFETQIAPILNQHCTSCHGDKIKKARLDLRSVASILKGGESGEAALVAGKAGESRLIELIEDGSMPPKGKPRLSTTDFDLLKEWINTGASTRATTIAARPALTPLDVSARQALDVLDIKCSVCHGRKKQEGGLSVLSVADLHKGGKHGPVILPGQGAKSPLYLRIHTDEMPPLILRTDVSVKPVSAPELENLKSWIDHGAIEPPPRAKLVDDGGSLSEADRQWWAYQPPKRPTVPKVKHATLVRTPIDAFLLEKLEAAGLSYSPEADRRTLLRRVTFALTGLAPTPAEVETFLSDHRDNAYELWVDRLLESPRYGERMAQAWLDAAGYSESDGGDGADPARRDFYHYRDYVIRSFNTDKPFDRFITEQIAGDELADTQNAPKITPELADNLIATGFLRGCVDPTDRTIHAFLPDRYQVLADTVSIVDSALMGLTMGCARCHSHKYDPISHVDYYSMSAIFATAYAPMDWVPSKKRGIELGNAAERKAIHEHNAPIDARITALQKKSVELAESYKPKLFQYKLNQCPEAIRPDIKAALELPEDKRTPIQQYFFEKLSEHFQFKETELAAAFPDYKAQDDAIKDELLALRSKRKELPVARGLTDVSPDPQPFYLQRRGEPYNRGDEVVPNVPAVLAASMTTPRFEVKRPWPGAPTSGRRLAFARWLTQPDNPVTARVFVNRVWQQLFGTGIVPSVDNFGRTGTPPSNPAQLDWLATEFIAQKWSVKELHRRIVTSTVYRQQSRKRPDALKADPDNRLLSRMPLRRLDAESLRDSIHQIAGSLSLKMFGPAVDVIEDADGQATAKNPPEQVRRSIYTLHRRTNPLTMLDVFDAPRMSLNCTARRTSNISSQALLMLNSPEIITQAGRLAERVENEAGSHLPAQVELAYRLTLSRPASPAEQTKALAFLKDQTAAYPSQPPAPPHILRGDADLPPEPQPPPEHHALADFCLVLLNSPEFLYVD